MRTAEVVGVLAFLLAGGCAGRAEETAQHREAPPPSTVSPTAADPPTSTQSGRGGDVGGISAEEAKRRGVFAAEFDARLVGPLHSGPGRTVYRLDNIGSRADTYQIVADRLSGASVTPSSATLDPGKSARLVVELGRGPGLLRVRSAARGDEVASSPLEPA